MGIKPLVNSAFEGMTLTISLINWTIKSVKDKNQPRWQKGPLISWLQSPAPFRKTGSEKSNEANIKRILPSPEQFSSWNGPDCCPLTDFFTEMTPLPQSRSSNGAKGVKTICDPPYLLDITPVDFFSLLESNVGAGWSLIVPGQLQDELRGGHLNHHQRRVHLHLSTVVWALHQVHLDRQRTIEK